MKKVILGVISVVLFVILAGYFYSSRKNQSITELNSSVVTLATSGTVAGIDAKAVMIDQAIQSLKEVYGQSESGMRLVKDIEYWNYIRTLAIDYYSDIPLDSSDQAKKFIISVSVGGEGSIPYELEIRRMIIHEVNGRVNNIVVPPAPDKAMNDASLAGIDTNKNGVRDDIDRMLAQKFGTHKDVYDIAYQKAKLLQALIIVIAPGPLEISQEVNNQAMRKGIETPEYNSREVQEYSRFLYCHDEEFGVENSNFITYATLNTPSRSSAYGSALAGINERVDCNK